MPIKRTTALERRRDWPTVMSHVAYVCAAVAFVLVVAQFWLYSLHFNRIFNNATVSAVTLTNGQTYFGRLEKFGTHTVVLFNPYYLQVNPTTTETTDPATTEATGDSSNLQLKKLTDDFHQPNDYLIINRDQVLYWQHLELGSPIIQAMVDYQSAE